MTFSMFMNRINTIWFGFSCVWLLACVYIAYEGQFISNYLESRGVLQEEYDYPWSGVSFCCGLYFLVIMNYILLFSLNFSQNHPYLSYALFSITPCLITMLSFLGAMHASSYWGAFIMIMMVTLLAHFLVLPFLFKRYRQTLVH